MVTRLQVAGDRWIDVKDRLKVRDKRDVHGYSVEGVATDGQTYRFSIVKHHIATAAVRIVNWNGFLDDAGKPVLWPSGKSFRERVAAIEELDEEVFEGITDAMSAHASAVEVADEAGKAPTPAGETDSTASLPSAK